MMIYLKNVDGFKMDYFKGMSYDDIRPIFEAKFNSNVAFLQNIKEQIDEEESRALKRINETPAEEAAKRHKLDEEVKELKRHLQIVPNEEDDVYTEATPLALKVSIVDYETYNENNKPYYKIKRADGSHQLYLSFLSLLRNFDREDLEALWRLVKERFATTKPKNFSDDFLLITLGAMFEKPDIHAQIWKNQRSVYGQAKVKKRKYPLTKFNLNQMLNNVRLEVKEGSEVSLELLRNIRRIRACTHQIPQRKQAQYLISKEDQYAVLEIWNEYNILEDIKRRSYSKKPQYVVNLDNSTSNVLIPLDSWTSGLLV
nr:hypothetical protein [Tanacetum cinerariifolium]